MIPKDLHLATRSEATSPAPAHLEVESGDDMVIKNTLPDFPISRFSLGLKMELDTFLRVVVRAGAA